MERADQHWLDVASSLASGGWGLVHPNPMVGCVLVRDEAVVGEGFHARFGGPHAEVVALDEAGEAARGATAYVSLEPCAHHGKTPPCTNALVRAGVRRVVYGAADPGPGAGGHAALVDQGVQVDGPCFTLDRARSENPGFFHALERGRPWVALKLAVSRDGGIAEAPGRTTRLTGPEADRWVQRLRAGFGALLVGGATAAVDDPRLNIRGPLQPPRPPLRVIVDTHGRLPASLRMLREPGGDVHVFSTSPDGLQTLRQAGATVHAIGRTADGVLDWDTLFGGLYDLGVQSVLCEGGGRVGRELVAEDQVQRVYILETPRTLGPGRVPAWPDPGLDWQELGWRSGEPSEELGADTRITLRRDY